MGWAKGGTEAVDRVGAGRKQLTGAGRPEFSLFTLDTYNLILYTTSFFKQSKPGLDCNNKTVSDMLGWYVTIRTEN